MNVKHTLRALGFATLLGFTALSGSALAAGDQTPRWWEMQAKSMANKDGMVSKADFMRMMEKKFDEMDKSKKGMLSMAEIRAIFMGDQTK